jgi:hypothetical protein
MLDELETQKRLFENLVNSKSGLEKLKAEAKERNASFTKDFDSKRLEELSRSNINFYDIKIQESKI